MKVFLLYLLLGSAVGGIIVFFLGYFDLISTHIAILVVALWGVSTAIAGRFIYNASENH